MENKELLVAELPSQFDTWDGAQLKTFTDWCFRNEKLSFLTLGSTLKYLREKKRYKEFGDGGYDTWGSFLGQYKFKEGLANVYIRVYEYYIERLKLPQDEVLEMPLWALNNMKGTLERMPDEQRDEFIEKVKTLSAGDLRKELIAHQIIKPPKLLVHHCKTCNKIQIEYRKEEICMCTGSPSVNPIVDRD